MGERHIIPISGKDSVTAGLVQIAREPDLPYEFVFCDIGTELPETYAWLRHVEERTGWRIQRVGKSLESLIAQWDFLPSHQNRYCTKHAKIAPLEKFYGKDKTFVYYGLRADEARVGVRPSDQSIPRYPLIDLGIDIRGVWTILNAQGLLPPDFFWPSLYYRVCELLGDQWPMINELAEWEQRMLFAGRTRSNCYFCFYQRQYELLWLAEVHPDLSRRAGWLERQTGRTKQRAFTFLQGTFFDDIVTRRREILDRRANEIVAIIRKRLNKGLFDEHGDTEIALTSCGLLCGK